MIEINNIEEYAQISEQTIDEITRVHHQKIQHYNFFLEDLEDLSEVLDISNNKYEYLPIWLGLRKNTNNEIKFPEDLGTLYSHLIAFKKYEELFEKQKKEILNDKENEQLLSSLDTIFFIDIGSKNNKIQITPEKLINDKNSLFNVLIKINKVLKEIHDKASVFSAVELFTNYRSESVLTFLRTFKELNFDNAKEADESLKNSYKLINTKIDLEISINDDDIKKEIGENEFVMLFTDELVKSIRQHDSYILEMGTFTNLDVVKFFIKRAIYNSQKNNDGCYFQKNIFNIELLSNEEYDKDSNIEWLLDSVTDIKFKISSVKEVEKNDIKEMLIEAAAKEAFEFISVLKEDRRKNDYINNYESVLARMIKIIKRGSKNFEKDMKELSSGNYQFDGEITSLLKKSKKSKSDFF